MMRFQRLALAFAIAAGIMALSGSAVSGDAFRPLDTGLPIAEWFPVQLSADGTWDIAIRTSEDPARVGVFDPQSGTWLDGPRVLPVSHGKWGATTLGPAQSPQYFYLSGSELVHFDPKTSTHSSLWEITSSPRRLLIWGATRDGDPLVIFHDNPGWYLETGGRCSMRVYTLLTGQLLKSVFAGVSAPRLVFGFSQMPTQTVLVLHESHTYFSPTDYHRSGWYFQSISFFDRNLQSLWGTELPYAIESDPPRPPWRLRSVDILPGATPESTLFILDYDSAIDYWPTYPLGRLIFAQTVSGRRLWAHNYPTIGHFAGAAVFDLDEYGNPSLLLPLSSGEGWVVRSPWDGTIIDTLRDMPAADLRTGPLIDPNKRDLFYVAGSIIHVWGIQTQNHDGEDEGASVPRSPALIAFPNPFNSNVVLSWGPQSEAESLEIFNVLGQLVRRFDFVDESGGSIEWNAKDAHGRRLPSGLYFARLTGRRGATTVNLVLIK